MSTGDPGLKGSAELVEPTRAQRAIARRSAETRATVPDVEFGLEVDAGPALARARDAGVTMGAVVLQACAGALREHPQANAAYRDAHYEFHARVNVAVTITTADGYLAPTVLDADARSLADLQAELERLTARARAGELTPPEMAGATFTLTDLGPEGVHRASPIITPPQAGALAAGAIRACPVIRDGAVVAGHLLALTLAADNRILFGEPATQFLRAVGARLESGPPASPEPGQR